VAAAATTGAPPAGPRVWGAVGGVAAALPTPGPLPSSGGDGGGGGGAAVARPLRVLDAASRKATKSASHTQKTLKL